MFEKVDSSPQNYTDRSNGKVLTFGESFKRGIIGNFVGLKAAGEAVDQALFKTPGETPALNVMRMYDAEKENGNVSSGGFLAGDIAGFAINPLTYITGGVTGAAIKGAATTLATAGAKSAVAKFAYKGLQYGAESAAVMVPYHVQAEFDKDKNSIDWQGVGESAAIDFGIGVAFAGVPFGWGALRGKVKGKGAPGENSIKPEDIDTAFASKAIDDNERQFLHAVSNNEKPSPDVLNAVMAKMNVPFDSATGRVNISMLPLTDIKAMYNSVADSLGSTLPADSRNALNNYIMKGQLEKLVKDPTVLDGLQGIVDHFGERALKKEAHLSHYDQKIVEPFLTKGLTRDVELTQEKLYMALKNGEPLGSVQIPKNVRQFMKDKEETARLNERLGVLRKESEGLEGSIPSPEIAKIESRLAEMQFSGAKLLHPTEEMQYLRQALTNKAFGGKLHLDEDFTRLSDLTAHWPNAKMLHKRVLREEMYERQKGFAQIAEMLAKIGDDPDRLLGSTDQVIGYMKERISRSVKREENVPRETSAPRSIDEIESLATTEAEKDGIQAIKQKVSEFKNTKSIRDFVSCFTGLML